MQHILPPPSFLHELAEIAEKNTLQTYLRHEKMSIDTKIHEGLRFDPVTNADRETELLIRNKIQECYPDHAIMGEEWGKVAGNSPFEWIIDPIDGTRPFICGLPIWGCLIGLYYNGQAVMGMMSQPYTGDRFWSDGQASWFSGRFGERRMEARKNVTLDQAILHTTSPEYVETYPNNRFDILKDNVLMTRYGGECYAMAMLAAGNIDICIEYTLETYDIAALIPIIEHAGGVVTTIDGKRPEQGGSAVATANPELHQQVLKLLNTER